MKARKVKAVCGIPGCRNKPGRRGACQTCMREILELGPEREAECIDLGYIRPSIRAGRPRSSKVLEALKSK
jgi:hypothetical protein